MTTSEIDVPDVAALIALCLQVQEDVCTGEFMFDIPMKNDTSFIAEHNNGKRFRISVEEVKDD